MISLLDFFSFINGDQIETGDTHDKPNLVA